MLYSWRTEGAECPAPRPAEPGPCQLVSPERLAAAETACRRLLGPPFSACHDHVEPGLVYNSCLDDVCACRGSLSSCFCPLLAAYADRCGAKVQTQYIFRQYWRRKNIQTSWTWLMNPWKEVLSSNVISEMGDSSLSSVILDLLEGEIVISAELNLLKRIFFTGSWAELEAGGWRV